LLIGENKVTTPGLNFENDSCYSKIHFYCF